MKNRKIISTFAALLLVLSLLLSACQFEKTQLESFALEQAEGTFFAPTSTEEPTESTAPVTSEEPTATPTEEPTEATTQEPTEEVTQEPTEGTSTPEASHTPYQEYERVSQARLQECSFDEITYERPDAQSIIDDFTALQKLVENGATTEEILEVYIPIDDACYFFSTMNSYAYIRYTLDLNDTYYDEEYNWCEEQMPLIAQAEEKCFIAMADSAERETLEKEHFGEDFFDFYDENRIYSNDRVVELMQQESALEAEYMALQSDQTITWKGEETLVDDLWSDSSLTYNEYLEVYSLYYDKYSPKCAEIYIELIKIRNEMAAELEYDSYADFAFSYYYKRDYTPEQVEQYLDDIAAYMNPLYYTAAYNDYSSPMTTEETMQMLKDVAYTLGGSIATAYDYMIAYDLYDITESSSKLSGSYMTYLYSYEMPFMYISPTNDIGDLMTASHEFGHFVDGYVNCMGTSSIDCNEIFSQALEYLTLGVADLSDSQRSNLRKSQAANAVMTFLSQACYADFEMQLYHLPENELTLETFNRIFAECYKAYFYDLGYLTDYIAPGWCQINHFFIAPQYVISYCVSLDAALQVYQCELEDGSGLENYLKLMSLSSDNTILALLSEAEMTSPFAADRMKELSKFLQDQMK